MSDTFNTNVPHVVIVRTTAELQAAYEELSWGSGGEIRIATDVADIAIHLSEGGPAHVTVTSENPDAPVTISQIRIGLAENITITHLDVNSAGTVRPDWQQDMHIDASSGIEISHVNFTSIATEFYDNANPESVLGASLGMVRDSTGISFHNNTAQGNFQGLYLKDSKDIDIVDNTFSQLQGDGIRMEHVHGVTIQNNTFSDFLGSVNAFNHDDMIQIWASGAGQESSDITISGNVFDSGSGVATQSIFIRNEAFDSGVAGAVQHQNIEISDNLIYNGMALGIAVLGVDGLSITQNTLLWNRDAVYKETITDPGRNFAPEIRVDFSTNATVTDNIASATVLKDVATQSNNITLNYVMPTAENYVGRHFINMPAGADTDPRDMALYPDSPFNGTGSSHIKGLTSSEDGVIAQLATQQFSEDSQTIVLDASLSVDEGGFVDAEAYTYRWVLPDNSILTGQKVEHMFDNPGPQKITLEILEEGTVVATTTEIIQIEDRDLLVFDFDLGIADQSSNGSAVALQGASLVAEDAGTRLEIGAGKILTTTRDATQYHALTSFGFSIEMEPLDSAGGSFMRLSNTMLGAVNPDGTVVFYLTTDKGSFRVDSGQTTLSAGNLQTISVSYSDAEQSLRLFIDGIVVGEAEAYGTTVSQSYHAFSIGSPWDRTIAAMVDQVYFGSDPSSAIDAFEPIEPIEPIEPVEPIDSEEEKPHAPVDLISFDFEGSDWQEDIPLLAGREDMIVEGFDGKAFKIGEASRLVIDPNHIDLDALDSFGMSIDLRIAEGAVGRYITHLHEAFVINIDHKNNLNFHLMTDTGLYTISTDARQVTDGQVHTLTFGYSADAGQMEFMVDGESVGILAASGVTAPDQIWGLTLGNRWWKGMEAEVDNVRFTENPEDVGIVFGSASSNSDIFLFKDDAPQSEQITQKGTAPDLEMQIHEVASVSEAATTATPYPLLPFMKMMSDHFMDAPITEDSIF